MRTPITHARTDPARRRWRVVDHGVAPQPQCRRSKPRVQQQFGSVGPVPLLGDANNDGSVTGADLISVQQNFGAVAGPAAAVPEPATAGTLLGAVLAMTRRRRAA